jgi:uncharacterized repeat protein (TIGR01451 family)
VLPNRAVTGLAFDPLEANVAFVSLSGFDENTPGRPGHVFGGVQLLSSPSWINLSPSVDLPFNAIVDDPGDHNNLWAGSDIGIWRSSDAGSHWTHMGPDVGMPNVAVFDLKLNDATNTLIAATHGRGAFALRTSDQADMAVTKTAPASVVAGQNLNYTITVSNAGPTAASNALLTDTTPANTTFVSLTNPAGWSCTTPSVGGTGDVNCTNPSVAPGISGTFMLLVNVTPGTPSNTVISNTANVSSSTPDPNPGNNSSTANTTVSQGSSHVVLDRTSLAFGGQKTGTTSPPQMVTLTNTGNQVLNITSITPDNADYTESDNCGSTVAAGGNCQIALTFGPSVTGPDNGNLVLTDDADNSPQNVTLTGTGTAPAVTLSQTGVDFGTVPAGTTSSPQSVTLTNSGTAPLNILGIGTDNPDFNESDNCPTSLAPSAQCTLTLIVTPSSDAGEGGNTIINDDASNNPQTVAMTVNGGTAPHPLVRTQPSPTPRITAPVQRTPTPRPTQPRS